MKITAQYTVIFSLLASSVFAESCSSDHCLKALKAVPTTSASSFCAHFTSISNAQPSDIISNLHKCGGSPQRVSSACSCLYPTTLSTLTSSHTTSSSSPNTSTSPHSTSTSSSASSTSSHPSGQTASTVTITLSAATMTVTQSAVTITSVSRIAQCANTTITDTASCTITGPVTTITTTVTQPATTVTASPGATAIDQNGCPAINGDSVLGYVIYCGKLPSTDSFAYMTSPGYSIGDCAAQCFNDPDSVDCLATLYTAPAQANNIISGALNPGTCTFYEFVLSSVAGGPGDVLAVFDGLQ